MTFWCKSGIGSGSADPCLWLMDPDPAIFVIDLHDASKKLTFNTIFSACYFLKVHLHYFSKIKSQKESKNSRIQCFSYYFCMMIEGSGSRAGSGPLTSGSRRPKKHVDPDPEHCKEEKMYHLDFSGSLACPDCPCLASTAPSSACTPPTKANIYLLL